jgi:Na+-translocating ferredoxin:NAD+ oxidoreductase RnfC subunit
VVGAGGAGFPTHIKLNCKAEIAIANGAECEPLLHVDQMVMQSSAKEIVRGLLAVMEQTGAKRGAIATKAHYTEAIAALREATEGTGIILHLMKSYYPAGDEQEIVYDLTGKVVPTGGLPIDVGAVVLNVSTLVNIARAMEGIPVTDKIVTVGGAVAHPLTVNVPVGTPISKLIEAAGGMTRDCSVVIGGPAMGTVTDDLETVVTKTTGGILCIPKDHKLLRMKMEGKMDVQMAKAVCCQCMMCSQLCPRNAMGLNVMPHKAVMAVAYGDVDLLGSRNLNGIFSCCDCGICTYFACNFGLKPGKVTQGIKAELMRSGVKPKKEVYSDPDKGKEGKKVPTSRLISRLNIEEYDVPAPLEGELHPSEVRIPLKMHIGAQDTPVVHVGDIVQKGQLIAEPEGMGAKIHASISGKVVEVDQTSIKISES